MRITTRHLIAIIHLISLTTASAFNVRNYTVEDGLSNMSVLSLMQDNDGYIWAATVDGLNKIANTSIKIYGSGDNWTPQISGNLIEQISETTDNVLWVHTNYGLDRIDQDNNTTEHFRKFNGIYKDAVSPAGDVVVFTPDNKLHAYNPRMHQFTELTIKRPVHYDRVRAMTITNSRELWIITDHEALHTPIASNSDGSLALGQFHTIGLGTSPIYWSGQVGNDIFYFVTLNRSIMRLDTQSHSIRFIYQLPPDLARRGQVSAITDFGDDFIIGFKTGGAVMLDRRLQSEGYDIIPLGISSGVFSILKDRQEDIVWVGTDGEGVYCFMSDPNTFISETFSDLPFPVSKPVRAVFKDINGDLWLGTKGDGIIQYPSYAHKSHHQYDESVHITPHNSTLLDNSIYAFAPSRRNLFWIGGDGNGINYYSFLSKRVERLPIPATPMLRYIHGIEEIDNELWVATVGYGVFRIQLDDNMQHPTARSVTQLLYMPGRPVENQFFSIYSCNDSVIWIGNRGNGLYRLNRFSAEIRRIDLSKPVGALGNDILAIGSIPGQKSLYLGTSAGLVEITNPAGQMLNVKRHNVTGDNGVNTIHAIAGDNHGCLWATTNYGLVQYIPHTGAVRSFDQNSGIDIISYSDGAVFMADSGECYFGGTNGFVYIENSGRKYKPHLPPIRFHDLLLNDREIRIARDSVITLPYDSNNFSIEFGAVDYMRGYDYQYRYRLLGASETWINNHKSSSISFTNLSPGNYTLQVQYYNGEKYGNIYELPIHITPPWYASTWAYTCYILLILICFVAIIAMIVGYQHRKRHRIITEMDIKKKEDVYESKLRFFTNITHELCTPLSLISGSCQRMLSGKLDSQSLKLATLIQRNSNRLNELIQELIEFRRIDTDHRTPDVENVDVSTLTADIADNFNLLAEQKRIQYTLDIKPGIVWPTDRSGFITIVTNLISNAFKYTPDEGTISLSISTDSDGEDVLLLIVANSGAGIPPENIDKIFDRYKVLERLEQKSAAGTFERNGLGLAICHGLTKLLKGEISVSSEQNKMTTFSVKLPRIPVTRKTPAPENYHYARIHEIEPEQPLLTSEDFTHDKSRPTMFIVDDEQESLWLLCETFKDRYNVYPFVCAEDAEKHLSQVIPDIIITDIIMGEVSGIEFTRHVKTNKATAHVPVIQLSSLHSDNDKLRGMEAGADIYLTKPYNIDYICSVASNLLKRNTELKDYYESPISSFDLIDGKILHKEDKAFIDGMLKIIQDNITNPELSTQFVADKLKLSVRNLYRRIEGLTGETPSVIIKNTRLDIARQLLLKTNLSIEEIIYKAGFSNRGTFFKLFSARFGCTPRQFRDSQLNQAKDTLSSDKTETT